MVTRIYDGWRTIRPTPCFRRLERRFQSEQSSHRLPGDKRRIGRAVRRVQVSLHGTGLGTTGVVLCNQVRTLDLKARKAKRLERAPAHVIEDVLAVLQDIFEP
jgi:hypothetical protein